MSNIEPNDLKFMLHEAGRMLGTPYKLGAKWSPNEPNPKGPIDCSGFVRWVLSRGGISIPDGSYEQILACHKEVGMEMPGDLGFFKNKDTGVIDHVGMIYDDFLVIEARGAPYNEVIVRPIKKWEAYEYFVGWYTYGK
jgi:cell wall-associated NlpC family hydrolase